MTIVSKEVWLSYVPRFIFMGKGRDGWIDLHRWVGETKASAVVHEMLRNRECRLCVCDL